MEQHTSESFENLEPADRMKYEIAEELGLLEKVRKGGWKALSSRETGQIGGMVSRRKRRWRRSRKRNKNMSQDYGSWFCDIFYVQSLAHSRERLWTSFLTDSMIC